MTGLKDRLCIFATKTPSGLVICNAGPQGTEEEVIRRGCGKMKLVHECMELIERQRRVNKGEDDPAKDQEHPPYITETFHPTHNLDRTKQPATRNRKRRDR